MDESSPPEERQIRRRSKHAYDACRSRKVKCLYDNLDSVCKACRELAIRCTYEKPRRRRGPPNQYALSQSRATMEPSPSLTSPSSTTKCGLERLAPFPVIEHMIHDWFELIHSVCPIFHRGIFLNRLASGEASQDGIFAALVISVCAAVSASLKRKSTNDYSLVTSQRCLDAIEQIELHTGRFPFSLESCQMKYHLCVALGTEKSLDDVDCFRLLAESVAVVKYLVHYQMQDMDTASQQLLKRLYWLLFVALCTLDLHGRPYIGLLTSQDNISALTPLELSDNELDPTLAPFGEADAWHGNEKSYIAGLNYLSKLFLLWHQSQQGSNNSIKNLQHYSILVQRALDYLPPELNWRGGLSRPPQSNFGTEVQTANLYITQLHIRSNLLEQIRRISKTSGIQTPPEVSNERQSIVGDMLEILHHTSQETLEASGHSLIPKIRELGSVLLEEVRTGDMEQGMSPNASVNLERLLAKLEDLDMHSQLQYLEKGPLPDMRES